MTPKVQAIAPAQKIESRILLIRGHKVMLDSDLAKLYGVSTRALTRAVFVNIEIMRGFVKLRETLATHRVLARKLARLEKRIEGHDEGITAIFEGIRELMELPEKPGQRIGFHAQSD